jgi:hypothetical protein
MAQKTYTNLSTTWDAPEAQEVNDLFHNYLGAPTSAADIKNALHSAPGPIGDDTASTGAFTTLAASSTFTATGNATFTGHIIMDGSSKQLQVLAGTAAAPVLAPAADTNTGVIFPAADTFGVSTGGTERYRVTSSGYVQASNTGTYVGNGTTNHEFCSSGTINTVFNSSHASGPGQVVIKFTAASPDDNSVNFLECTDSTTNRLKIASDGDVYNHDNTYGAISDVRLKQDVADATSQWNDVKNLRLRKYRMKSDVASGKDQMMLGMVADEVEAVSPGLVRTDATGTKHLIYSIACLKLFGAFQEAQKRIEALEARLPVVPPRP